MELPQLAMNLKRKTVEEVVSDTSAHDNSLDHQPARKKSKTKRCKSSWIPKPAFWDNLSFIPLTKRALQELDRRTTTAGLTDTARPRQSKPFTTRSIPPLHSLSCPSRVARHGGLDLTDLIGFPNPLSMHRTVISSKTSHSRRRSSNSRSNYGASEQTATTKSTGPHDRAFLQHLIDNHILPYAYRYPDTQLPPPKPKNWTEIQEQLARPRNSLLPTNFTDEDYEHFAQVEADAPKEKQISESLLSLIEGKIDDVKARAGGLKFTNLEDLTDGNICPGNPDVYYGARPETIKPDVRKALKHLIIPSTQHDLPAAPNFMLAAKGPDGLSAVALRQAQYDGALGARGVHALQNYLSDAVYDGNAYCVSATYHAGLLRMFTSHPIARDDNDGRPEYVLTQIGAWAMIANVNTLRDGIKSYRNLRDWAGEQRAAAIKMANDREAVAATVPNAGSATVDLVPGSSQNSLLASPHAHDLSDRDQESDVPTETLPSFAITESDTASRPENIDSGNHGHQPLKHPGSPPRPRRSKRSRQVSDGAR